MMIVYEYEEMCDKEEECPFGFVGAKSLAYALFLATKIMIPLMQVYLDLPQAKARTHLVTGVQFAFIKKTAQEKVAANSRKPEQRPCADKSEGRKE